MARYATRCARGQTSQLQVRCTSQFVICFDHARGVWCSRGEGGGGGGFSPFPIVCFRPQWRQPPAFFGTTTSVVGYCRCGICQFWVNPSGTSSRRLICGLEYVDCRYKWNHETGNRLLVSCESNCTGVSTQYCGRCSLQLQTTLIRACCGQHKIQTAHGTRSIEDGNVSFCSAFSRWFVLEIAVLFYLQIMMRPDDSFFRLFAWDDMWQPHL